MLRLIKRITYLFLSIFICSCHLFTTDYSALETFDEDGNLQVVIENTTGSTSEVDFCRVEKDFLPQGEIAFAFPANNGFIPSTSLDLNISKSSRPIDVFVVSKALETGNILTVKPLGVLKYKVEGTTTYKIVAVPTSTEFELYAINGFHDFSEHFVDLRKAITEWTLNKNKTQNTQLLGWYDEDEAFSVIKKHMLSS